MPASCGNRLNVGPTSKINLTPPLIRYCFKASEIGHDIPVPAFPETVQLELELNGQNSSENLEFFIFNLNPVLLSKFFRT